MDAPSNLICTAGDATKLDSVYEAGTFDAVFSYWLMPHLSLYATAPAKIAAAAMLNIAKSGGKLSIGPVRPSILRPFQKTLTFTHVKTTNDEAEQVAEQVVSSTRLNYWRLVAQRVNNAAMAENFDTTRHSQQTSRLGLNKILVPSTGKYHNYLSPAAMPIVSKLAVSALRQLTLPSTYHKVAG